jgi:hypothetical protein
MTKLMIASILAICLVVPAAFAQTVNAGTSTTHIFPHGVDGRFPDGTSYQSLIWIDNFGTSTANCTFTPLGFPASRFFESSFDIATNASTVKLTRDTDSFAQGPVILNCSQPVLASLTYGFFSPSGAVMGMATVFSARPVTITTLQVQQDFGRFGVALANTSNVSVNLQLRFNGTDGRFVTRTVTIAPNSSLVGFVDQLLDLSGMTSRGVFIASNVQSSTPFYVTGLMFVGPVFTTLVPAGA